MRSKYICQLLANMLLDGPFEQKDSMLFDASVASNSFGVRCMGQALKKPGVVKELSRLDQHLSQLL